MNVSHEPHLGLWELCVLSGFLKMIGGVCILGLWGLHFVECVYSSGLIEKQGSLFLTGCVLLSPTV